MTPLRKSLAVLLALALLGTFLIGATGRAAAAQNAPSWSTGNQWVYNTKFLSAVATLTMTVREQTSLTIGTTTYPTWRVNQSISASSGSITFTLWVDQWLTVDGLKQAKQSSNFFGPTTAVYDPPQPQMVFPLTPGASWSGTTSVTTTSIGGTTTVNQDYSGTVTAEQTITVPAGTFATEVIRSPETGTSYTLSYYSEQVGYFVRVESYSGGALQNSQNLTSYSYSPGLFGISNTIWVIVLVVALLLIVASVIFLRRRPRMPYGMPPQQPGQLYPQQPYQQPPYQQPPQQPPQQGPPGP